MSEILEAIVLRRVVLNRASLTGGALALHNYQMGLARADSEMVFRDDVGSFHFFKSDSANELKYSQLGHIHDDRYYTETEVDSKVDSLIYESSGIVSYPPPQLVINGDGTLTMPSAVVRLYDNPYYIGIPQKYTIPSKTFTAVNLQDTAIIAHYNSGSPEYRSVDQQNISSYNLSDSYVVQRAWKAYGDQHSVDLGSNGLGAIEKVRLRTGQTQYYGRVNGLALGSTSTPAERTLTVTGGNVWAAFNPVTVLDFNSSVDLTSLLIRNAGVWTKTVVTQWPNTVYNDNAGAVTMTNNSKYGVVWVYRTIGNVKECFLVLGKAEYNNAKSAEAESPRSDVDYVVSQHAMLVGRIIFQKSATTATDVQSAFTTAFTSSVITSHLGLSDLQGGQAGQYYHLTQLEWETKILGLGITGRIPLFSEERKITSSALIGDSNGIYPVINNSKTLGSTSLRFSEIWGTTLYEAGTTLASRYEGLWERATVTASSDLNNYLIPGTYAVSNAATATNMPSGAYGWGVLQVLPFSTGSVVQMYMPHRASTASTSGIWMRVCLTGTWQDWQHIYGDAYNATKYASLSGAIFTGDVYSATDLQSGGAISSVTTITAGTDFAANGFSDLRGELLLTGLQVSTANADASIADTASGFVNTATYTANRTVILPVPKKGKILTLSNLGSSTTYNVKVQPANGTSIHYGITPTLVGGNGNGIKSLILEGVSDTKWMVISMWTL